MRKTSMLGRALALMVAASAAALAAPTSASADPIPNATPDTAIVVTDLPYESSPAFGGDGQLETSELAAKISQACNGGMSIYSLAWWKVAPTTAATFVANSGGYVGGIGGYEPLASVVLSGDLSEVLGCGTSGADTTRTGAFTASAVAPIFVATFDRQSASGPFPVMALIPSTGEAPENDTPATAKVIDAIPSQVSQDSTLAANGSLPCYSKFGWGPSLWYSWTATQTDLVEVQTSGYYIQGMVVIPVVNGEGQQPLCDEGSRFAVEAGNTYLIGVAGEGDSLFNVGPLTVSFSYAPPAPDVTITVSSTGSVNKKTGVATIRGQVTCTGYGAASTEGITGTLQQTYKRLIGRSSFSAPEVACTGAPVSWSASVEPTTLLYASGAAQVTATVRACNTRGCTTANAEATVTLKNGSQADVAAAG